MKAGLSGKNWLILIVAAFLIAAMIFFEKQTGTGFPITLGFSTILILLIILVVHQRLQSRYQQIEASLARWKEEVQHSTSGRIESLLSLYSTIKPDLPLPDMRGWAASPDLLKKIAEIVIREKPEFIIELGSGASTVIIAYCLRKLGRGRVLSLEHDIEYAAASRDMLSFHGLDGIATVADAPLKEIELNGVKRLWYDLKNVQMDSPIDFLFIDGPPGSLQKLSRYPALPLLHKYFSGATTIVLDDGYREDEKNIAALWEKEYGPFTVEFLDTEKGAFLMRAKKNIDIAKGI